MRFSVIAAFVIVSFSSDGQDSLSVAMLTPGTLIKVSPLHLINFYPTIEVSFEQPIAGKFSMQLEGGYVLNYKQNTSQRFENKRGVKGKLEGRYYFWTNRSHTIFYYGALETYFNSIHFDRHETRTECFDTNCTSLYTQNLAYTGKYQEHGFSIKFGFQWLIRRFLIDINSGWTVRSIRYILPPPLGQDFIPEDRITFFDIPNEQDRMTLGPNLGIRLGYRLR